MLRVGVIGYGYWGPNLVRNFAETPGSEVVGVSDLRPERLALVRARYPAIHTTQNVDELLANPGVDAIAVKANQASASQVHAAVAQALRHCGTIDVLVASAAVLLAVSLGYSPAAAQTTP
jgi:predicted dehydrogenase